MSVNEKWVSRSFGTDRMSRNSFRVNPTLPAPIIATLIGISCSLVFSGFLQVRVPFDA